MFLLYGLKNDVQQQGFLGESHRPHDPLFKGCKRNPRRCQEVIIQHAEGQAGLWAKGFVHVTDWGSGLEAHVQMDDFVILEGKVLVHRRSLSHNLCNL